MISRTQGQPLVTEDQVEQVKQEEAVKEEEIYAHQKNEQEGTAEYCYEGEEETENSVGIHHSEADEYSNQSPSITSATPDIFNPWSHNQDNNVNVDHVASPSLQQYPSFNSQTFENQHDHVASPSLQQYPSFNSQTFENQHDHVASPSFQQYPSFNSQTFENQHDHVASPSFQQHPSFNSQTLENQHISSLRSNHPSIVSLTCL